MRYLIATIGLVALLAMICVVCVLYFWLNSGRLAKQDMDEQIAAVCEKAENIGSLVEAKSPETFKKPNRTAESRDYVKFIKEWELQEASLLRTEPDGWPLALSESMFDFSGSRRAAKWRPFDWKHFDSNRKRFLETFGRADLSSADYLSVEQKTGTSRRFQIESEGRFFAILFARLRTLVLEAPDETLAEALVALNVICARSYGNTFFEFSEIARLKVFVMWQCVSLALAIAHLTSVEDFLNTVRSTARHDAPYSSAICGGELRKRAAELTTGRQSVDDLEYLEKCVYSLNALSDGTELWTRSNQGEHLDCSAIKRLRDSLGKVPRNAGWMTRGPMIELDRALYCSVVLRVLLAVISQGSLVSRGNLAGSVLIAEEIELEYLVIRDDGVVIEMSGALFEAVATALGWGTKFVFK